MLVFCIAFVNLPTVCIASGFADSCIDVVVRQETGTVPSPSVDAVVASSVSVVLVGVRCMLIFSGFGRFCGSF